MQRIFLPLLFGLLALGCSENYGKERIKVDDSERIVWQTATGIKDELGGAGTHYYDSATTTPHVFSIASDNFIIDTPVTVPFGSPREKAVKQFAQPDMLPLEIPMMMERLTKEDIEAGKRTGPTIVILHCILQFHLENDDKKLITLYKATNGEYRVKLLKPAIIDITTKTANDFVASQVYRGMGRVEFQTEIEKRLKTDKRLKEHGIITERFVIRKLELKDKMYLELLKAEAMAEQKRKTRFKEQVAAEAETKTAASNLEKAKQRFKIAEARRKTAELEAAILEAQAAEVKAKEKIQTTKYKLTNKNSVVIVDEPIPTKEAPKTKTSIEQDTISKSTTTTDGLSVTIEPAKKVYAPHEDILFNATFKNVSDKPFMLFGVCYSFWWRYKFIPAGNMDKGFIASNRGVIIEPAHSDPVIYTPQKALTNIAGVTSRFFRYYNLSTNSNTKEQRSSYKNSLKYLPAGRYNVTITIRVTGYYPYFGAPDRHPTKHTTPRTWPHPFWTGTIETNPVTIEISDSDFYIDDKNKKVWREPSVKPSVVAWRDAKIWKKELTKEKSEIYITIMPEEDIHNMAVQMSKKYTKEGIVDGSPAKTKYIKSFERAMQGKPCSKCRK